MTSHCQYNLCTGNANVNHAVWEMRSGAGKFVQVAGRFRRFTTLSRPQTATTWRTRSISSMETKGLIKYEYIFLDFSEKTFPVL